MEEEEGRQKGWVFERHIVLQSWVCLWIREREKEREGAIEREREREGKRKRGSDRERWRGRERERERERERFKSLLYCSDAQTSMGLC